MTAFGNGFAPGPVLSICCGPRCGAEPGHRAVYDAIEKRVNVTYPDVSVRPTLCQGLCGGGVTVMLRAEPGAPTVKQKIQDVGEARVFQYFPFAKDSAKTPCPK